MLRYVLSLMRSKRDKASKNALKKLLTPRNISDKIRKSLEGDKEMVFEN